MAKVLNINGSGCTNTNWYLSVPDDRVAYVERLFDGFENDGTAYTQWVSSGWTVDGLIAWEDRMRIPAFECQVNQAA